MASGSLLEVVWKARGGAKWADAYNGGPAKVL